MLTIKSTRKTQDNLGFFESASIELENTKNKNRLHHYQQSTPKAGTNITTNIAFQTNTIINVHPKADPRSPRTSVSVAPEQTEAKQSKCCWPFSLCC